MYKKQMLFQRIVCVVMLLACALVFVYSLGLMTDLYDSLYLTMMDPENLEDTTVPGSIIYYDMQPFNSNFTLASIGLIIVSLLLFLTNTHSRRKYYIGNYIATALSVICNVGVTIWAFSQISAFKAQYYQIDFEALKMHSELWNTPYIGLYDTFWFDISFLVFGILLVVSALLVVNVFFKQRVMKGEQSLIGSRKDVSV